VKKPSGWSLLGIGLLVVAILFVQDCTVQRQNNANVNPRIFPAFKEIEKNVGRKYGALLEQGKDPEQYMSRRELWVYHEAFIEKTTREYYNNLEKLDYRLPPFYREGYEEKQPWWKFWRK
jgi:hypothetical protein